MNKKNITIVKLGGSIITDKSKPYKANFLEIKRLVSEIKRAGVPIILIHGGGSFAHTSAKKYGGKKGYTSLWGVAKVARDAQALDQIIIDELIDQKLPAIAFKPNSLFTASNGKMVASNLEPVLIALNQGLIPVLHGDVIMDRKWKTTIFSGETSTSHLVDFLKKRKINIGKIIQVGTTDGVYDMEGVTIARITKGSFNQIKKNLFELKTADVTGGMMHKVEVAQIIAKKGVQTYIINGTSKNSLYKSLLDRVTEGTIIL